MTSIEPTYIDVVPPRRATEAVLEEEIVEDIRNSRCSDERSAVVEAVFT